MMILVTGGIGFIGSHACVELLTKNYTIVVIDNLSNSDISVVENINLITRKAIIFHRVDVLDHEGLKQLFLKYKFDAVIHFAGYKSVNESLKSPLKYYFNNLYGTMILCDVMRYFNVKKLIFSSSATVYGNTKKVPIKEDFPTSAVNPYGESKLLVEHYLERIAAQELDWNIIALRYFNPIGAHKSALIGERPLGTPNNLMPYLLMVASKKFDELLIFGDDYPTKDGTGVRDYIHVSDLAIAHVQSLDYLLSDKSGNVTVEKINIGTGNGYSVLDMVNAFAKFNNVIIPYKIVGRRAGDSAESFSDSSYALEKLGWKASKNLKDMCVDSWKWELNRLK